MLPLAVWPCAQEPAASYWHNRRLPGEIARRAIELYSDPGDIVLDPLCEDATALIEAIQHDRNALGVAGHDPLHNATIIDSIVRAGEAGATGQASLLYEGDPPEIPTLLAQQGEWFLKRHGRRSCEQATPHPCRSIDLILLSHPATRLLGRQRGSRWQQNFTPEDLYQAASAVLRPGGLLVVATKSVRIDGSLCDLGGQTISYCRELGLQYWQHVLALSVPIRDGQLHPRRRRRRAWDAPGVVEVSHADVLVLGKPASSVSSGKLNAGDVALGAIAQGALANEPSNSRAWPSSSATPSGFGSEYVYETLEYLPDPRELGMLSLALQRVDHRWWLTREQQAALALALHEAGVPTAHICEMVQLSRRTLHRLRQKREQVSEAEEAAPDSAQPCGADVPKAATPSRDIGEGRNGTAGRTARVRGAGP